MIVCTQRIHSNQQHCRINVIGLNNQNSDSKMFTDLDISYLQLHICTSGSGMNVHDIENDDNESEGGGLPTFGSAGGIGTPSSSRARMLAQQREIQLKKRLSAIQSGGNIGEVQ